MLFWNKAKHLLCLLDFTCC